MYTVYKCNVCNEERETPLGGCFALNPLGVAPKGCLYMDDCAGTWQKVSASVELEETAPSTSPNKIKAKIAAIMERIAATVSR